MMRQNPDDVRDKNFNMGFLRRTLRLRQVFKCCAGIASVELIDVHSSFIDIDLISRSQGHGEGTTASCVSSECYPIKFKLCMVVT